MVIVSSDIGYLLIIALMVWQHMGLVGVFRHVLRYRWRTDWPDREPLPLSGFMSRSFRPLHVQVKAAA